MSKFCPIISAAIISAFVLNCFISSNAYATCSIDTSNVKNEKNDISNTNTKKIGIGGFVNFKYVNTKEDINITGDICYNASVPFGQENKFHSDLDFFAANVAKNTDVELQKNDSCSPVILGFNIYSNRAIKDLTLVLSSGDKQKDEDALQATLSAIAEQIIPPTEKDENALKDTQSEEVEEPVAKVTLIFDCRTCDDKEKVKRKEQILFNWWK